MYHRYVVDTAAIGWGVDIDEEPERALHAGGGECRRGGGGRFEQDCRIDEAKWGEYRSIIFSAVSVGTAGRAYHVACSYLLSPTSNLSSPAKQFGYGWNAANNKYCDLMEAGIVDPAKVTINAIINSASVAGLVHAC